MPSIVRNKLHFLTINIFVLVAEIRSHEQPGLSSTRINLSSPKNVQNVMEKKSMFNNQEMTELHDPSQKAHQNIRSLVFDLLQKPNEEFEPSKLNVIVQQENRWQSSRMLEEANEEEAEEGEAEDEEGDEEVEEDEEDEEDEEEEVEEDGEAEDEEDEEAEDEEQNQADDLANYFDDGNVIDEYESTDDASIQDKIADAKDKAMDDIDYLFQNDPRTWSVYHWLLALGSFLLFFSVFYCSCRCLQSCCSRSKAPVKDEENDTNSNAPYEAMA